MAVHGWSDEARYLTQTRQQQEQRAIEIAAERRRVAEAAGYRYQSMREIASKTSQES